MYLSAAEQRALLGTILPFTGPDSDSAAELCSEALGTPLRSAEDVQACFCELVAAAHPHAVAVMAAWDSKRTDLSAPSQNLGMPSCARLSHYSASKPTTASHRRARARIASVAGHTRHGAGDTGQCADAWASAADSTLAHWSQPRQAISAAGLLHPASDLASVAVAEDGTDALGETTCSICLSSEREEDVILCDDCHKEFHKACLNPPMAVVPVGQWHCSICAPKRFGLHEKGLHCSLE